ELRALEAAGLTATDLRLLVARGLAESGLELTQPADGRRRFVALNNLALPDGTCFVLAGQGPPAVAAAPAGPGAERPRWDAGRRELTWRGLLVKHFREPAPSQELLLAAFEEEDWPRRI